MGAMIVRAAALAALLAGCGGSGPAPSPAPADRTAEFVLRMKAMDLQVENLQADLAAGKPEGELKARLGRIRGAAQAASAIPVLEVDAENRDLRHHFDLFLNDLAALEGASWAGEDGAANWRRLGKSCMPCHSLYRADGE